jgi:hypothetical protein
MNRQLLALFLPFLYMGNSSSNAETAYDLMLGEVNANSRAARAEIAQDLKQRLAKLKDQLPVQRPSEVEWVAEEQAALSKFSGNDMPVIRMQEFYESVEFQHLKLNRLIEVIYGNLDCAISVESLRREIACWQLASFNLSEESAFQDAITILVRKGRLPEDIADRAELFVSQGYGAKFNNYARAIEEHIVLPYLFGQFTE